MLYNYQTVDPMSDANRLKSRIQSTELQLTDETKVIVTKWELLDEGPAWSGRIVQGDPVNGPGRSITTNMYYEDPFGVALELLAITMCLGISPADWPKGIALGPLD